MSANRRAGLFGLAALAILVIGASARSQEPASLVGTSRTFSWSAPIERTDGSPFDAASEADHYELTCNDDVVSSAPGDASSTTVTLPVGTYTCTVAVVDTAGLRSAESNAVNFTETAAPASAPADLTVE